MLCVVYELKSAELDVDDGPCCLGTTEIEEVCLWR